MIFKRPFVLVFALAVLVVAAACGDGPTDDGDPEPIKPILVLGDDSTEDSVMTILEEAGVDAEFGGLYWEWDGSGLDDVSAVFFLTGYEYSETVADSVQEALVDFVSAGGGIMTTEWLLYETGGGYYDMIVAMAPSLYDDDYDYYTETYTVAAPAHPIAQGLPASFATPDDAWSYSLTVADPTPSKQATVVITGSASGDAVVAGKYGLGRTVHWNMAGQYEGEDIWSTEVRQILVNIAKYISGAAS